jgi:hypothetical protein
MTQFQQVEVTKLYPQLLLFEALSVFKDKPEPRKKSDDSICETRRDFLDSFAYLCDIQKGGKTVTASALQKEKPTSNVLWLAANGGVSEEIYSYAKDILKISKSATLENQSTVQDVVFKLAVKKCGPRVRSYRKEVKIFARNCRMALRSREKNDLGMVRMQQCCSL